MMGETHSHRQERINALPAEIRETEGLAASRETNDPTAARAHLDQLRAKLAAILGKTPRRKILNARAQPGQGWGTYGRGEIYVLELDCGHTDSRPKSQGLPRSMVVKCGECYLASLKAARQ